ncbi:hypothetical protein [Bradyrhizobium sp. CER78]|uniref:DUF7693 family protein n=1 Tax=Bradyrhizobium sp. CER78 TaxID=3039162 RepID=UPI00244C1F13|nr:hypothetical protein [Bradyrhizobium sp. CER78]MDH2386407.1 hypothetical protein [Bradyrhizobium sp. CER78]
MSTDALENNHRHSMGLVTDHAEWKAVLAALESAGIPAAAATIMQEQRWDQQALRYFIGPHVEIEIRDARTWAMNEPDRIELEARLRAAAPPEWNGPHLVVAWRRPVAGKWGAAWLDAIDRLWRDWRRRRIADDAFHDSLDALSELHRRVWYEAEGQGPLLPEIAEILAKARRHPPAARQFPPLPPGQVDVAEVVDILRRIASGSARPEVVSPKDGWKLLYHGIGEFTVDGWSIQSFKRNFGMKYVQEARAPDGRTGDYPSFAAREGNPFSLLEDDEQDAICEILEGL